MKHTRMRTKLFALGAAIVLATTGLVANADDIKHAIATSAGSTITLNVGDPGGTSYSVVTTNGDGKNGCNLTGQTALTVDVISSDTSIVSVSAAQITFNSCGDVKSVGVTGLAAGTATISLSQVTNTTGGTFNLAPATFTVVVNKPVVVEPKDTTPPTIAFETRTLANGKGWNDGDVVVTWTCTDDVGVDESASTLTQKVTSEGANLSAIGTCKDLAGNVATHEVTGINIDRTSPVIELASRVPASPDEWGTSGLVSWSCTDTLSGVDVSASSLEANISGDGADQSADAECFDLAGNRATQTETGINVDATPPVIEFQNRAPVPNANGWNNSDVVVTWTCTDATSGVDGSASNLSVTLTAEEADQTAEAVCVDRAGNRVTASESAISIDKTAPTLSFESRTSANGQGWNNSAVIVTWTCTDDRGVDLGASTLEVTLDESGAGQSAEGTCVDLAGNRAVDTVQGISIDLSAPTIALESRTPANDNGWNDTEVVVTWTCVDTFSGVDATASTLRAVLGEGPNQSADAICVDAAGNRATASETGINVDLTDPVLAFQSRTAPNAHGWNNGDVVVTWTCEDALSGVDGAASLTSVTLKEEGKNLSAKGVCADQAGNTLEDTQDGVNIDLTDPVISYVGQDPAAVNGWNNTAVTLTWTCTDKLSGVHADDETLTRTITQEGEDLDATGTCIDLAGNVSSDTQDGINIDRTAPRISYAGQNPPAVNGWNKTDVTVTWNCADDLSRPVSSTTSQTVTGEGSALTVTGTCTDHAGNSSSATEEGIRIDRTKPTITWNGGPAEGSSHYFGSVPAAPTCTADDDLSGADGCEVTGYGTAVGNYTLTAKAADVAGNQTVETRSYSVKAWTISGFKSPVDMGKDWNAVKGGSTVPLKFEVFAGETELTDTSVVASFRVAGVACSADSLKAEDIEFTTTGKTVLRYDATEGQFIQNWQTPKNPGKCYTVTMSTIDGSSVSANFRLK
ncbi:hypothetical protein SAMN04488242_2947 [Tessaracoccus oleiagri]|uniref:Ig-like domain-containing protein n=2 Tax=Tessaracoccus oleiagri TaxID=686624 RepID=A0A1G9N7K8_9ACTN|nr:hypothetical protein SAMN04488242_2947 [Tessaracoccus oleiagri]